MVDFGNLKSDAGLKKLDDFLLSRSYISGYHPSQTDLSVFRSVGTKPNQKYVNVLRWFNHIQSYGNEADKFPATTLSADTAKKAQEPKEESTSDNDVDDLFGSDDEDDAEAERVRQERVAAYEKKKAGKDVPVAKSTILLDVKPWDDETDMAEIEKCVRSIQADGLLWGQAKLIPLAYGIKKLQIACVVEDDKVGTDFLEEEITKFEDLVQSVDIAAFNKL